MSMKRNDPCSCGSGKKYKKCCGKTEGAAILSVLLEESSDMQKELMNYAMEQHPAMLKKEFQPMIQKYETLRRNEQIFLVTFEIWAILTRTLKENENETILTKFVKRRVPSIHRQRTAEIVASWTDYRFMTGVIEESAGNVYYVRDVLTEEKYAIRGLRSVSVDGAFVTGALLPHESEFTFFMTDFHFEAKHVEAMTKAVRGMYEASPFNDTQAFFQEMFPAVMDKLFSILEEETAAMDVSTLTWPKEAQRTTAEHIAAAFEQEGVEKSVIEMAVLLWNYYCGKEDPAVRKPEVFTAALLALLQSYHIVDSKESKAAIAGRYSISAATLSKRMKEMEVVLEEKLKPASEADLAGQK